MSVVATLLLLGVVLAIDVYAVHDDPADKAAMSAVAASYLDSVRDGDLAAAYELACGSERKEYPLPRWRPFKPLEIESYRITRAEVVRSAKHGPSYRVWTDLRFADGRVDTWYIKMSYENAGWRVCDGLPHYWAPA